MDGNIENNIESHKLELKNCLTIQSINLNVNKKVRV